ncbi:MAG: hypothetical protein IH820_04220 [Bacteroidetes bacterium]|nr:hypothetical protein [Bacteroidota bacterium]
MPYAAFSSMVERMPAMLLAGAPMAPAMLLAGAPMQPTIEAMSSSRDGIWATAPYLHNGSVPTLHDLLLPVDQRLVTFHVGSREFDPVKVGYVTTGGPDTFLFDTSLPGNHNIGHIYGTAELSDTEREELVEYLKSL